LGWQAFDKSRQAFDKSRSKEDENLMRSLEADLENIIERWWDSTSDIFSTSVTMMLVNTDGDSHWSLCILMHLNLIEVW
jgi:DNA-binding transcriptional regulator YbjK